MDIISYYSNEISSFGHGLNAIASTGLLCSLSSIICLGALADHWFDHWTLCFVLLNFFVLKLLHKHSLCCYWNTTWTSLCMIRIHIYYFLSLSEGWSWFLILLFYDSTVAMKGIRLNTLIRSINSKTRLLG